MRARQLHLCVRWDDFFSKKRRPARCDKNCRKQSLITGFRRYIIDAEHCLKARHSQESRGGFVTSHVEGHRDIIQVRALFSRLEPVCLVCMKSDRKRIGPGVVRSASPFCVTLHLSLSRTAGFISYFVDISWLLSLHHAVLITLVVHWFRFGPRNRISFFLLMSLWSCITRGSLFGD